MRGGSAAVSSPESSATCSASVALGSGSDSYQAAEWLTLAWERPEHNAKYSRGELSFEPRDEPCAIPARSASVTVMRRVVRGKIDRGRHVFDVPSMSHNDRDEFIVKTLLSRPY
jgi:hypothetical protein